MRRAATHRYADWPPTPELFAASRDGRVFFRFRQVRRGWAVPVALRFWQGRWTIEFDGAPPSFEAIDPAILPGALDCWERGTVIGRDEYDRLNALRERCRTEQPDHPCLHPAKPINLKVMSPVQCHE